MQPHVYTLANGMQVILRENRAAPVISYNAVVMVGSADEPPELAGISHLMEHMLFKGTPTRPVGAIAREVEAAGGDINAYTSFDQTVFYINMASRYAEKGLEILADAVCHPTFDAGELEKEKEVILEEIRRERDTPSRHISEVLFEEAFQNHTYGRPIIGYDKTVKAIKRSDLSNFWKQWYRPKNVCFVVVGDFETEKMLKKSEAAFASFREPTDSFERSPRPMESRQTGLRIKIVPDKIQSIHYAWGFHIPQIVHQDVPALDVLAQVLGGMESSRLEQIVKEKKHLVQSIYTFAYTPKDPGLLLVGGQLETAKWRSAHEAIGQEIDKIKANPITTGELTRAKLGIRANEIYEKETVGGQAGKLSYFLSTAGDVGFEERYYQKLNDIQVEDVLRVAETYLRPEALSVCLLVPQGESSKVRLPWLEEIFEPSLKPSMAKVKPARPREPKRVVLRNGVRLILWEDRQLPIVAIQSASLGGTIFETKENNGINNLIAHTLPKGTINYSALEITRRMESMAGSLDGYSGRNSLGLKCEFLAEHLEEGCKLFCDVLLKPSFDPKEVEKEKQFSSEAIRNQEDQLATLAFVHFQKTLFQNHPYGLRLLGEIPTLKRLGTSALKRYYQRIRTGKNLVISVAGDFSSGEVVKIFTEGLKSIPARTHGLRLPVMQRPPTESRETKITKQKKQAHLVYGFLTTTMRHPDHYPLIVLSQILAGQGGRLFIELRDKLSLAYSVSCVLQDGIHPGYLAVYIGTEPGKVKRAVEGIRGELNRISSEKASAEELERTKQYLVGTYELELQKNSTRAAAYASNELFCQGIDEVKNYPEKILKVTAEDVLGVAKKYIRPDAYTMALVD